GRGTLEFLGAPLLVEPFDNLHHREDRDGVTAECSKVRSGLPDSVWVNALEYLRKDVRVQKGFMHGGTAGAVSRGRSWLLRRSDRSAQARHGKDRAIRRSIVRRLLVARAAATSQTEQ